MQQSSRDQAPLGVRLPLAKFSYTATALNSHARMVWTHVNGNGDLFCEIEERVAGEWFQPTLILKVVQNDKTLEHIDLGQHVRELSSNPRSSQDYADAKPVFAVMVKVPSVAIKYPQDSTHMRRFQVRFTEDRHYYTTLSMLSGINCPLAEGAMPALRRPPSSLSGASVPTVQMTKKPLRDVGNAITPESNAPGSFGHIARTASDMETVASNAQSISSTKLRQPISVLLPDPRTVQNLESENEPPVGRSPRGNIAQTGQQASQPGPARHSSGLIYRDQELNRMLPPKRDLPFAKPKSKMSRADTSSLKSSQQIVPESSYPEPDIVKRRESLMSESQSQQLIQTQPYPETLESLQHSSQIQATLPYPDTNTQTQQPAIQSSAAVSSKHSQTNGRSQPNGRSQNDENVNAPNVQEPQSAEQPASMSVEEQLAQYLKSPTPERTEFLNTWMCDLIQDENFVTLCEDMEGTWRRFAFGMNL